MPVDCERLANGRLDRPEEAMDLAFGVALAPPRKSDGSGLGIACACAVGRSEPLLPVLTVLSVLGVLSV